MLIWALLPRLLDVYGVLGLPLPIWLMCRKIFNGRLDVQAANDTPLLNGTIRTIHLASNGLKSFSSTRKSAGRYVHIKFINKVFDFIYPKDVFADLIHYFEPNKASLFKSLKFGWSYTKNLKQIFYQPHDVFSNFHNFDEACCCNALKFQDYCFDFGPLGKHVLTTDLRICHHKEIQALLNKGFNHIPFKPINPVEAFTALWDGWEVICSLLDIPISLDHKAKLDALFFSKFDKMFPNFRFNPHPPLSSPSCLDQILWLKEHFYFSGLDKSSQTVVVICKCLIRIKARERVSATEFLDCRLPLETIQNKYLCCINSLFSFIPPPLALDLPFLMATYKIHKQSFRWLTNAHNCLFSSATQLITLCLQVTLEKLKDYTGILNYKIKTFSKVIANTFWLIDSQYDFLINIPPCITSCYSFDVTSCYEAIPHEGDFSLLSALQGIFKFCACHKFAGFKIHPSGKVSPSPSSTKNNFMSFHDFLLPHKIVLNHCFVQLGPLIKQQVKGIPMGYACSPLWCNLYLAFFEVSFVKRLMTLNLHNILPIFNLSFCFIDDLAFINNNMIAYFLDPSQPLSQSNPYWIYPLHIINLKLTSIVMDSITLSTTYLCSIIELSKPFIGFYTSKIHWKKDKLPCNNISSIFLHSNRPRNQCYNVVLSQIIPIVYSASSSLIAYLDILKLIDLFIKNGFKKRRLFTIILNFLKSNSFPGIRFDVLILISWLTSEQ